MSLRKSITTDSVGYDDLCYSYRVLNKKIITCGDENLSKLIMDWLWNHINFFVRLNYPNKICKTKIIDIKNDAFCLYVAIEKLILMPREKIKILFNTNNHVEHCTNENKKKVLDVLARI